MCEERAEGRKIGKLEEETCAARVCNDGTGVPIWSSVPEEGVCGSGGFNRGRGGGMRIGVREKFKTIR
jgi:hypothetical protein